jgi:hypothetical protein
MFCCFFRYSLTLHQLQSLVASSDRLRTAASAVCDLELNSRPVTLNTRGCVTVCFQSKFKLGSLGWKVTLHCAQWHGTVQNSSLYNPIVVKWNVRM